ncbi:ribonuclease III [Granulicatella sp. zg-ZJ]|uniref:ribonuclease III n=1 Tax=unclassified Granulicatella TaxID=2630493 RepID=UPI0013BF5E48|nr:MULTISPECIES: ribonuclease III [unclassified Granulicatella]MBS4750572.1 ribonuclease III [Carnobacteriaceae bacterium zg-ZUI78]NEW62953.1 ribonuclease III [Granulicatella sp. zg-ZJ]NEW66653.1 ribonuclease III [Granulicatella sp. zg-84]QMI85326.1 ribonuclease III [Carnobacteriaceae bacterium zg-84]
MDIETIVQKKLGMRFSDVTLLKQAFTHASYANEKKYQKIDNNERLEFLGDAVLELVVSDYLFHNFLQWPEGKLTRFRAQLVCEQTLSTLAKECGFDELVLLGKGEDAGGGRKRDALLCDVFEAFIGALYLDKGLDVAKAFILSQLMPKIHEQESNLFMDYKTLLQERLQKNGSITIQYTIVKEEGLAHDKEFEAVVSAQGKILGRGIGKNKKAAEQAAAKQAYEEKTGE